MELLYLLLFSVLYLGVFISALLTSIGMLVVESNVIPLCGLYLTAQTKDVAEVTFSSANPSTCHYVEYVPLAVTIYSLISFLYYLYPVIKIAMRKEPSYTVPIMLFWGISCPLELIIFVAACIISTGFSQTCKQMAVAHESLSSLGCDFIMSNSQWHIDEEFVKDPNSYNMLQMAQISIWICVLVFGIITGLCTYLSFFKRTSAAKRSQTSQEQH